VKELTSSHQDKKGFWRKPTAIAGLLVALTACERQPEITDGTVYKKQHIEKTTSSQLLLVGGKVPVSIPVELEENWRLYIAQCATEEARPVERIEKECKTNSFAVPQEVYNSVQIEQQADFKQTQ
jgi:hypothetical protein